MSKPFDASLKDLIANYPADWLALLGLPAGGGVEVIDADVSTVTAAADKVLRIRGAEPWLLHLELQSSPKSELTEQLHWYNTLLRHRHGQPVSTVVVLLRRQADSPRLNGLYHDQLPGEPPHLEFRYRILRLWQIPSESLLAGGLGVLPLAPLGAASDADLPGVVRQMGERLITQATPEQAAILGAAAVVLTGLRLSPDELGHLYEGVRFMSILDDSSASVLIGANAVKKVLLRQGRKRFGPPDEATELAIRKIWDIERLERMSERLLDVSTWADLLATT